MLEELLGLLLLSEIVQTYPRRLQNRLRNLDGNSLIPYDGTKPSFRGQNFLQYTAGSLSLKCTCFQCLE